MEMRVVDDQVKALMRDPVLRLLADRMATHADPVHVHQLWRGFDEPTKWFAHRMRWYWWGRWHPGEDFPLKNGDAPAKAVIAVYKHKRALLIEGLRQR